MDGSGRPDERSGAAVYRAGRRAGKPAVPLPCRFVTAAPVAALLAGLCVSGCAVQLGPVFGDGETTGSITPRDGRFSVNMTDEDWRQAQASVGRALGPAPAGRGATAGAATGASWSNPLSGLKGTATPVAGDFAQGGRTCRAFLATLVEGVDTNWYQGTACQADGQGWRIVSAGPWRPPGREAPTLKVVASGTPTLPGAPLLPEAPATSPALPSPALPPAPAR